MQYRISYSLRWFSLENKQFPSTIVMDHIVSQFRLEENHFCDVTTAGRGPLFTFVFTVCAGCLVFR